jgi:hypothetical protein
MDEHIESSLRKLLSTLEQAEETAWRSGKYSELIALTRAHLMAMHFWGNEDETISNLENIYVPDRSGDE